MNMPESTMVRFILQTEEKVTGHAAAYTRETPFALEPTLTEVRLQDEMPVREATVQET